jgi:hypothetical protein
MAYHLERRPIPWSALAAQLALLGWLIAGCGGPSPLAKGSFARIVAQTSDGYVVVDDGQGTISAVSLADGSTRVVLSGAPPWRPDEPALPSFDQLTPTSWSEAPESGSGVSRPERLRPVVFFGFGASPALPHRTTMLWSAASGARTLETLDALDALHLVDVSTDGRYVAHARPDGSSASPQTYHLVIDRPDLSAPKVGPAWTWMWFRFVGDRLIVAWTAADASSGLTSFDPETGASVDLASSVSGQFVVSMDEKRVAIASAIGGGVTLVALDGSGTSLLLPPNSALPADAGVSGFLADGSLLYEQRVKDYTHAIDRIGPGRDPQRVVDPALTADQGAWVEGFSPDRRWFLFSQMRFALCRPCEPDLFVADPDRPSAAVAIPTQSWFTSDSSHLVGVGVKTSGDDCVHAPCTFQLQAASVVDARNFLPLDSPAPDDRFKALPSRAAQIVFSRTADPHATMPTSDLKSVDLARADPPLVLASGVRDFAVTANGTSVVYLDKKGLYRVALPPAK